MAKLGLLVSRRGGRRGKPLTGDLALRGGAVKIHLGEGEGARTSATAGIVTYYPIGLPIVLSLF